jgi:hypothetical protein
VNHKLCHSRAIHRKLFPLGPTIDLLAVPIGLHITASWWHVCTGTRGVDTEREGPHALLRVLAPSVMDAVESGEPGHNGHGHRR